MDEFKSAWNDAASGLPRQAPAFKQQPPVARQIKRQLLIEAVAWVVFIAVFRDAFDGDTKPLYLNILLVAAFLLMLVHNVTGYLAARNLVNGPDLRASLARYAEKLRVFGIISVGCRALAIGVLLWFFASAITFTATKYWMLAGIVAVVFVQLFLLGRIWAGRVKKVSVALKEMSV
ncbi:hypothetical protein MKQ70_05095 [Chitinophaga sedimenti]|uniref:hypothetical protein n=1 Tax=Chitinophaga sedimenti TaxID=2033606 RepID=UPI002004CF92|nr:hypothetical protein [Chitinophaga sedimenti]MCK7554412.1 hypothetical protein [Chitinophaga sedimenti]